MQNFLIIACISFTVTLLKSFEVDSSHMLLSSEVKSSRMWSSRRWSIWGHFSLKSGHISVPQRLAGLVLVSDKLQCSGNLKLRLPQSHWADCGILFCHFCTAAYSYRT